jgi:O-antigen ligase
MNDASKSGEETELQSSSLKKRRILDRHLGGTKWSFFFLLVFTALYLARPEDTIPALTNLHLPEAMAILAILCYLVGWLRGGIRFRWTGELKIMLALTIWFLVGLPFSIWRGGTFGVLTQTWSRTLLIFLLLSQTAVTIARIRRLLWVILFCETFVAALSIVTLGSQAVETGERLKGAILGFLSGNEFGIILAVTLPFLTAFLVICRSFFRTILILTAYGTLIAVILLNASRGGVICFVSSCVMIPVSGFGKSLKAKLLALVLVGMFLLGAIFAPRVFVERLKTIWGSAPDDHSAMAESARASTEQRYKSLKRSIQFTVQHPVFGVGLGNFVVASGTSTGKAVDWIESHNTFTQVSSEAGIPALCLYVGLFGVAIRNSLRIAKARAVSREGREIRLLARASIISLLTFALGAFFVSVAYNLISFYFFLIPVCLQLSRRWSKTSYTAPAVEITTVSPELLNTGM